MSITERESDAGNVVPLNRADMPPPQPESCESFYRDLLEALPAAIYTTDAEGRITFYNQAAADLAGTQPRLGVDKWCVTWKLFRPDGEFLPHDECPMAVALKTGEAVRGAEAVAQRPDGTAMPFLPFPTPLKGPDGRLVGAVNMLVDITERKQAEQQQRMLLNELNHRVKNTLAIVQSIAFQSLRSADSPEDFVETFESRLIALSRAHELLARGHWGGAGLHDLLGQELQPYADGSPDRVRLDGPLISLPPKMAIPMALALHELAAASARTGALSEPGGRLEVSWQVTGWSDGDSGELALLWMETDGPPAAEQDRMLSALLERTVHADLGGRCEFEQRAGGPRCAIVAPLAPKDREPDDA